MFTLRELKRSRLLSLNPEVLTILGILGFYSLVGFVNKFMPIGGTGSMLLKGSIYAYIMLTVFKYYRVETPKAGLAYIPGAIFLTLYGIRLLWNFEIDGVSVGPGENYILLHFFIGVVLTTFATVKTGHLNKNDMFFKAITMLCLLFLVSLLLNAQELKSSWSNRLALEKINPISLAHLASAFILYYIIAVSKNTKYLKLVFLLLPILFLIFVQAKSRGAFLAIAGSLLVYAVFAPGKERIKFVFGTGLFLSIFLVIFGESIYTTIVDRMGTMNKDDNSTLERMMSWEGAWNQFLDDPTFGRYFFEQTFLTYPHNIYLESLISVGIGGTIFLVVHMLLAYYSAVSVISNRRYPMWAVFIAVLFIRESIAGASAGALWSSSGFWITSFFIISLWFSRGRLKLQ